ncbi:hypothetical protein EXIGLDRAFT_753906 [Exidia glandulosa HHB12029]|uniref:C4-dicarboxylate transporter/malic acid transport protein n=1 Tax=Exidia glandulosa HHB12029 TaxID=1314781 RepID=A0A165DEA5_EXIGL|nr:hypothetical protein EXIGLDRAFT_753906 [Exidia glandulosa HHB12029]
MASSTRTAENGSELAPSHPSDKPRLRERIRQFPPSWHAVIMGTGVVSILFHAFPYGQQHGVLRGLSWAFTLLNGCLFVVFSGMTVARYILFPYVWRLMLLHPVQSLFLGCIPMGFATLVNQGVNLVNDYQLGGNKAFVYTLWAAWGLDAAVSVLVCFGMVHIKITRHKHSLENMTAAWLLPVVAPIVASTTGQLVAGILTPHSHTLALLTSTVSLVLVLIGLSLSLMIFATYYPRLVIHGLPATGLIISVFLPLGPCAQGGYSLLLAADILPPLLPALDSPFISSDAGTAALRVLLLAAAFMLWVLGTMWLVLACLAVWDVARRNKISFALPFWGLIFPNGVYTLLTLQLGKAFGGAAFFVDFGAAWAALTLVVWIAVAIPTVRFAHSGTIFYAPCLDRTPLNVPRAPEDTA